MDQKEKQLVSAIVEIISQQPQHVQDAIVAAIFGPKLMTISWPPPPPSPLK